MRLTYEDDHTDLLLDNGFEDLGEVLAYDTDSGRRAAAWTDEEGNTVLELYDHDEDDDLYSALDDHIEYVDLEDVLSEDPPLNIDDPAYVEGLELYDDTGYGEAGVLTRGQPPKK